MSQAINLENTNAVFYNENSVEKLLLNGKQIWEAAMTILSVTKATTKASELTACVALDITTGSSPATVTYDGISKTAAAGGTTSIVFADTDDHTYPDSGTVYITGDVTAIAGYSETYTIEKATDTVYCPCVTGVIEWGKTWHTIGGYLFYQGTIEELHLPSTITAIAYGAFAYPTISRLYVPSIEYWFNLDTTNWGSNPLGQNDGQLYANNSLVTSIVIPSTWTTVPGYKFAGITSLQHVTIPEGVTSIGEWAFKGCTSLTSVIIPSSVTTINRYAFSHCTSLISITIPEGVTSIGNGGFYGCTALTSITLPNSITSISSELFRGCTNLTTVMYPANITKIYSYAFYECTNLTTMYPNGTDAEQVFRGTFSFYGCSALTTIEDCAFMRTSPDTLDLQDSGVTTINCSAFNSCTSLLYIAAYGSPLAVIKARAFYGDYNLSIVGFPDENLEAWRYGSSSMSSDTYYNLNLATKSVAEIAQMLAYPSSGATFDDSIGELTGYADKYWFILEESTEE